MTKRSPRDRARGHPGPELSDKDHEFILRNEKANKALAKLAIARAMAEDGMIREEAEDLYGLRDQGPLLGAPRRGVRHLGGQELREVDLVEAVVRVRGGVLPAIEPAFHLPAGQRAAFQLLDRLHHGLGNLGHGHAALLAAERDLPGHQPLGCLQVRRIPELQRHVHGLPQGIS